MNFTRLLRRVSLVLALVLVGLLTPVPAQALDVNDFSIDSFQADYYLSRDEGKRSQMRVVEEIVAVFPEHKQQNHGIERAIPKEYDGHTVRLDIVSVKKASGQPWKYTTYDANGHTVLRIGDADEYVNGTQAYILEYKLRDVTKGFAENDELYWDVNGTQWKQAFGSVVARLHLDGATARAYNGQTRCFSGREGATDTCAAGETSEGSDEIVVTFTTDRMLYAGENMTFAVGFEKGTFSAYQPTTWERLFPILIVAWLAASGLILVGMIGVLVHASRKFGRSPRGRGTIVPEYLPPKDMSVLVAANVTGRPAHAVTAQIIDLAVRHYLKVYEVETRGSWFRNKRTYELELTKAPGHLLPEEKELIGMIFDAHTEVGQRVTIELLRSKLYQASVELQKGSKKKAESQGYFTDRSHERRRFYWVGGLLLAGGVVLLLPGAFIAGIATFIVIAAWRPLTEKGVERRDYLKGLKMYMKLAEAERIRQLQSPDGAAKSGVDPSDPKQLVKLYEHLLPYAILFGIEKAWIKEFALLYEQPPEWYVGNWSAFHGAAFAASITSFTAASNTAFSPSGSSSSSGISGGGSSGGGGGGGGGNGW